MNPRWILSIALSLAVSVNAAAAQLPAFSPNISHRNNGVDVTITTPATDLIDVTLEGRHFQSIGIQSDVLMGTVGGPGVPASSVMIELPDGFIPSLTFDVGMVERIEGVKLAPLPLSSSDNSKAAKNLLRNELYEQDNLIPEEIVSISRTFSIGNKRYAILKVSPFQYNPVAQSLSLHRQVEISVNFIPDQSLAPQRTQDAPVWRELANALSDEPPRDDVSYPTDNLGHLVIIVPNNDNIANAVTPLVAWKKRMGYVVTVVRLERDVQASESAIKTFLEDAWQEWELPPTYILLVGDATTMPCFRDGDNEGASWYISDNQYVTYGANEGNEIDGWISRSFIGRLPSQSAQEVTQMVNKIINYETTPFMQQNWIEGGAMLAAGVHSCITTNQAIREQMIEYGYAPNRIREAYAEYHAGQPNVDANAVTDAVNTGVGFVNFRGYDTWGGYTPGIIRQLRNDWKLPIVTGMVCATNDFANRFGAESVGEAWVRAYNNNTAVGAVASYGPTDRHTHTWFNNTMDGEFYRLLYRHNVHTLGALCLGSKLALLRNYPSLLQLGNGESVGYYFFAYNLLGDPSLQVRTRRPEQMTVTYNETVPVGTTNLAVTVTDADDAPLAGAYIHYFGDDDNRWGAYSDANGEALIEVPPLEQGTIKLTVTAVNFVPFLDEMSVSAQSRTVSLAEIAISDDGEGESHGNSDGFVTPGETLEIAVTLANRGSDVLRNTSALLESSSQFVQISRAEASFGTLEADDRTASDEPYLITVLPGTPSGTKLDFLLTVTSGEDSFPIQFSRFVVGYDLESGGSEILGEGAFTPGSTREMIVNVRNIGDLVTGALTGTLYCSDRNIQIRGAEARFAAIVIDEAVDNVDNPFELSAGPNSYLGGIFKFGLLLEDEAGLRDSVTFEMVLGAGSVYSPQGPDNYGYWAIDSRDTLTGLEPNYERLQGNNNLNLADNNDVAGYTGIGGSVRVIDLPFSFVFYGERYRRITVSSNGFIVFGESISIAWNNQELGSGLTPAAMVAPWWDDLYSGGVFTRFDEDNSRFIIEWRNFASSSAQSLNFSLTLYDPTVISTATGDGEIVVNYTEIPAQRDLPDEGVTIGISAPDDNSSLTVRHARTSDMRTGMLRSGLAVKFTTGESVPQGSIVGHVSDLASGAPMMDVRIMLEGTGFFAVTNENGDYMIEGVAIGTYSVLAHKRYFNDAFAADIEVQEEQMSEVNFDLTNPSFAIDIENINVVVPPDSVRYRRFAVTNGGNGPLDYSIDLRFIGAEPEGDTLWSTMFDWDVTAITGEQTLRGVTADDENFYFSGQRRHNVYPHPMFVVNKLGELVTEFAQIPIDSAARGYSCVDNNEENIVAAEDETIVEFTSEGEFVRSIPMPDEQSTLGVAYSPERGTYFSKAITGSTIYEFDPEGNLIEEHPTPVAIFRTYGFAWHPADPEGYNLYTVRVNQENTQTEIYRMNPRTNEWLFVQTLQLEAGDLPLDIVITKRFNPLSWTLGVLVNRQGGDHLIGYKLDVNTTWIDYEPHAGTVEPGATQEFNLVFTSEDMPRDEYHVSLDLTHNAEGERFELPVTFTVGDEVAVGNELSVPTTLRLDSFYPNPFNSTAHISFSLPQSGKTRLLVFDASGRELKRLELGRLEAGGHSAQIDGADFSSGIYIVKIESQAGSISSKIVLLR